MTHRPINMSSSSSSNDQHETAIQPRQTDTSPGSSSSNTSTSSMTPASSTPPQPTPLPSSVPVLSSSTPVPINTGVTQSLPTQQTPTSLGTLPFSPSSSLPPRSTFSLLDWMPTHIIEWYSSALTISFLTLILTIITLNKDKQTDIQLAVTSFSVSLSTLLSVSFLTAFALSCLLFLSKLSVSAQAVRVLHRELDEAKRRYASAQKANSLILVPYPLDKLVERGIDVGYAAYLQQQPGIMQATVRHV